MIWALTNYGSDEFLFSLKQDVILFLLVKAAVLRPAEVEEEHFKQIPHIVVRINVRLNKLLFKRKENILEGGVKVMFISYPVACFNTHTQKNKGSKVILYNLQRDFLISSPFFKTPPHLLAGNKNEIRAVIISIYYQFIYRLLGIICLLYQTPYSPRYTTHFMQHFM